MHALKGDPALRDLEHVKVDDPGMAYLFFFDKQGCRGLKHDATEALRMHVVEAFSDWISHSSILPSIHAYWWRAGIGQWQIWKGAGKGPGWSTKTTLPTVTSDSHQC